MTRPAIDRQGLWVLSGKGKVRRSVPGAVHLGGRNWLLTRPIVLRKGEELYEAVDARGGFLKINSCRLADTRASDESRKSAGDG